MTSEETFREAFASVEVNTEFTEAALGMRDGSRLLFHHRVGERWARAEGDGLAGQMLALIGLFRLNRKHLDILFHDGSRWEAWFGA